MNHVTIQVTILVTMTLTMTPPLLVLADLPPGLAGDTWGREYCRAGYCAIMPSDRWQWCCDHYRRCCAYVEFARPQDPFYFEKPRPQQPTARPREEQPPASVQEPPTAADQPSRSSPLQEGPALLVLADQPQPEPQPQPQPPSYSQTKPAPDPAHTLPRPQEQPPRSYNEVLKRDDQKMCRPKYCAMLSQEKHRRCCDLYRQCCAYADLRRVNDPFYFEKHPRNF